MIKPQPKNDLKLILLFFLGLRVLQSISNDLPLVTMEHGYTMTAAWELIHNRAWPYQAYQITDWENGSLLTVLLTVPFCLLFGPSIFALRMVGILFSAVTLVGLYLLCRDCLDRRSAVLIAVLYISFPDPILQYSMNAHGIHPQSMAIQVLFLWWLMHCCFKSPKRSNFFLLGLLGGLSVYFAYISAICLISGVIAYTWPFGTRIKKNRFQVIPFCIGLLIGISPWFFYNAANDYSGFSTYHGSLIDYVSMSEPGTKLPYFFRTTLPMVLGLNYREFPHVVFSPTYLTAYIALSIMGLLFPYFVYLARRLYKRKGRASCQDHEILLNRIAIIFFVFTLYVFYASSHRIDLRHMVPLHLILLVVLVQRHYQVMNYRLKSLKVFFSLFFVLFVVNGVVENLRIINWKAIGIALYVDGRNYKLFYERVRDHYNAQGDVWKAEEVRKLRLKFPQKLPGIANRPNISEFSFIEPGIEHTRALKTLISNASAGISLISKLRSAGLYLGDLYKDGQVSMKEIVRFCDGLTGEQTMHVIRSFGRQTCSISSQFHGHVSPSKDMTLPKKWLEWLAHGEAENYANIMSRHLIIGHLGYYHRDLTFVKLKERKGFETFIRNFTRLTEPKCSIQGFPSSQRKGFFEGLGYWTAKNMIMDIPKEVEEAICEKMRPHFRRGAKEAASDL